MYPTALSEQTHMKTHVHALLTRMYLQPHIYTYPRTHKKHT